jgi:hypothetical protein
MRRFTIAKFAGVFMIWVVSASSWGDLPPSSEGRPPRNETELEKWLSNMVTHHKFDLAEMRAATGLSDQQIREAVRTHLKIDLEDARKWPLAIQPDSPLVMLPYPGGRHPRIGFLEGAVDPQRETKFSVFTPWDPHSYVVVDLPEAVWSNLGLTYLAHTHVPTLWTKQGVALEKLEWDVAKDGSLSLERRLPNGISFKTRAQSGKDGVRMRMSLTNGTAEPLSDLRVQMCTMLKGAKGFEKQTNDNKLFLPPLAAVHDGAKSRWIITGWEPVQRVWGNSKCPCLHADPRIPDCPPGETREVIGWLSFYEGTDIYGEMSRIYRTNWRPAE